MKQCQWLTCLTSNCQILRNSAIGQLTEMSNASGVDVGEMQSFKKIMELKCLRF